MSEGDGKIKVDISVNSAGVDKGSAETLAKLDKLRDAVPDVFRNLRTSTDTLNESLYRNQAVFATHIDKTKAAEESIGRVNAQLFERDVESPFLLGLKKEAETMGLSTAAARQYAIALNVVTDEGKKLAAGYAEQITAHERYQAVLDKGHKLLLGLGAGVAAWGVGLLEAVKHQIDAAASMSVLSEKTGIAVEDLSKMKYAADLSETSLNTLARAMKQLPKSLVEATGNSQSGAARAFAFLEIDPSKIKNMQDGFNKIADAIRRVEDPMAKSAALSLIFKRNGEELIPFFNNGSEGLARLAAEGEKWAGISGLNAERARELKNQMVTLEYGMGEMSKRIATDLVPRLNDAAEAFLKNAREGDKVLGVFAALDAFFFGNDKKQAAKYLVDSTDALMAAEQRLDVARSRLTQKATGLDRQNVAALEEGVKTLQAKAEAARRAFAAMEPPAGAGDDGKPKIGGGLEDLARSAEKNRLAAAAQRERERLAREAQNEIDRLLAQGVLSEENAARARYDIANEAYIAQGQRDLKAVREHEDLLAKAHSDEEKAYITHTARIEEEYIANGQAVFKAMKKNNTDTFDALKQAVEGWGRGFSKTMGEAVVTGNISTDKIKSAFMSLAADIAGAQIQKQFTDPIVKAGTSWLNKLFSGEWVSQGHSGALAGIDGAPRLVPAGTFDAARRLHAGGLAANEVPMILEREEEVLTRRDPRHRYNLGGATGGTFSPNIVFNFDNRTGQPVQAKQSGPAQFDGEKYILSVLLTAVENNPSVRNTLAGALR
jgi:hypothetical protein